MMRYFFLWHLIFSVFLSFGQETTWNTSIESIRSYSSPRPTNINNDNTLDVVFGGGVDGYATPFGVNAIDGLTGEVLWAMPTRNEMFGSPSFIDVNNDGIDDVVIAGRDAELRMINGQDGSLIWEFWEHASLPIDDSQYINPNDSGWYNFYNVQVINDLNNDGIDELLCSNGGDHSLDDIEINRPPGHILIVDSYNGNTLFSSVVPDSNETYMSPIFVDLDNSGDEKIIFGTGGETIGGSLFICEFEDLLNNDLSNSTTLITSELGIIAPPSLGDLNNDNILDIVVQSFDGTITAINGDNYDIIWQFNLGGVESSVSPTLGLFSGSDNNVDVFCINYVGQQSSYSDFYQILIDGENGEVLYLDSISDFNFSSAVAFDHNSDGKDEVLISTTNISQSFIHDLILMDFINDTTTLIHSNYGGDVWSTPLISDLDSDNYLDIVFITQNDNPFVSSGINISRLSSNYLVPNQGISWASYMGTNYNSKFEQFYGLCSVDLELFLIPSVSCPGENSGSIDLITPSGQAPFTYSWSNGSVSQDINGLSSGNYTVIVSDANGCQDTATTFVGEYSTSSVTNNPTCYGATDGSIYFSSSGCSCNSSNCQFTWALNDSIILEGDGSSSSQTHKWINNIGAGTYTATIVHPDGCQIQQEFTLEEPVESQSIIACESYEWNGQTYTESGIYEYSEHYTNNNYSMSFDGDDYISLSSTLLPSAERTVSLWFKSQDINLDYGLGILGYGGLSDTQVGATSWIMIINNQCSPGGLNSFEVQNHWDQNLVTYNYGNINYNSDWHHLSITTSDNGTNFYINGILVGTSTTYINNTNTFEKDLIIGNSIHPNGLGPIWQNDCQTGWIGELDDIQIWNYALSQSEIQQYLTCPPLGNELGLVGYWNFEEGSGDIVYDLTSNSNNGIINGAIYSNDVPEQSCQFTTLNGCDSVAVLNLTINESNTGVNSQEHCDEYTWIDGVTYTESNNTATYTLTNVNDCDSVVTLDLTLNYSNVFNESHTACNSYDWNGETYDQTGSYTYMSTNAAGCDSVVTLDLTISQLELLSVNGDQIAFTETENNTYSISNPNSSSTYFWSLSNNVGSIDGGNANNSEIIITWAENDSETILCVFEEDEFGCQGEESCITIDVNRPSSIKDFEKEGLFVYPNPFTNQTIVSFYNPTQSKVGIKVIDSRGSVVREHNNIISNKIIITKEELSEGLYYILLNLNDNIIKKSVVIQ